jgi:dipeptidyl aminopeptidase/acylaminoacyl peptidase
MNRKGWVRFNGWRRTAWASLAAATVMAVIVLVVASGGCGGDETPPGDSSTPTRGPVGTITAAGRLAFIAADGNLTLINPDGSGADPVTESGGVQDYAWSPDGSLIAVARLEGGGQPAVDVIRPAGEAVFEVVGGSAPLWSPQGDRLLVERSGGLEVVDAAGQPLRSIANAVLPDWSPEGSAVAFIRVSQGKGVPMIVFVESGEESALDAGIAPENPVYPVIWHPAGAVLAYRNDLYEPTTGARTDLPGVAAYFSPDGRLLLVVLDADPTVTGRPANLLDLTQGVKTIIGLEVRPAAEEVPPWLYIRRWTDWGRDGGLLLYMDPDEFRPKMRIYDTVGIMQDSYSNIRGEYPDLSPDSTHLAFQYEGRIEIFPLNGTALVPIAEGSLPRWEPVPR